MNCQREILHSFIGKRVGFYGLIMLFGFLLADCISEPGNSASETKKPVASQPNAQYHLVVEFYGEHIGADSMPMEQLVVNQILVRDTKTGRVASFIPEDAETLQNSFGYFTGVWSPDNAYLVLPLGRFQGFVLFSSKTVMQDLQQRRFHETIQIRLAPDNSPMLWHEFIGWQEPHIFQFSAGLSGRQVEFLFDPATGEVRVQTAATGLFRAITKGGMSEVGPMGGTLP
jgi:hypothetical protein